MRTQLPEKLLMSSKGEAQGKCQISEIKPFKARESELPSISNERFAMVRAKSSNRIAGRPKSVRVSAVTVPARPTRATV